MARKASDDHNRGRWSGLPLALEVVLVVVVLLLAMIVLLSREDPP